jgi:hypothetical protein
LGGNFIVINIYGAYEDKVVFWERLFCPRYVEARETNIKRGLEFYLEYN